MTEGIELRHRSGCPALNGRRCNCDPSYRAKVWSNRDRKPIRKTFSGRGAREAAKKWRADALLALDTGALRAPNPTTVREAWQEWYEGARAGTVRNRSGDVYKPSAVRSYERAMRLRVLPEFGATRLADIRRPDLQEFVDGLLAERLNASTIQVTLLPLRSIFNRAVGHGELAVNPCDGLAMPAVRGRRERFATPREAAALIAAVPAEDRPAWATLFYAGLRRGELRALAWDQVDLGAGLIRVCRGYDDIEGITDLPKTDAGRRNVPIPAVLRDYLDEHRLRTGDAGLVFAGFNPKTFVERADRAWRNAGLTRITPHGCRHTFASLMIAAGVNAKALSTYMGHANISITLDRYGHLMPGSEEEAAGMLDAYLAAQQERADEQARAAELDPHGTTMGQ